MCRWVGCLICEYINIFLNLEGGLGKRADFINEYQPLTSGSVPAGRFPDYCRGHRGHRPRRSGHSRRQIDQLISAKICELDRASTRANFESAQISFFIGDRFGIKLGRARNPFGFWDDYSLFRNLSALKTDPVSLGVALRRADQGVVAFGRAMGASYSTWQPMSTCTTSVEIRRGFLLQGGSKDRRNVLTPSREQAERARGLR